MNITETKAKSILRKHKRIDSWFISHYNMNLYRGCAHNCVYCDGRSEKYYVKGEFGNDIEVKVNAPEILDRELDPKRKRKPMKQSFILLGGGVGDGYQPVEETFRLSRQALELLYKHNFPVHVLTKSTTVIQDIDILKQINAKTRALVSFSFSSVDEKVSSIFEPGVPSPDERLEAMAYLKRNGISCGMFLMPVIPFITDTPQQISASIKSAKEAGADFIIFSGMTLKEGKQKNYFMERLKAHFPEKEIEYHIIYRDDMWGSATHEYSAHIYRIFNDTAKRYQMPKRIPPVLYRDILNENEFVSVMLEHMDYFLKSKGLSSTYGYAAYTVSQLNEPISELGDRLRKLKGIGKTTETIIREILDTGDSSSYRRLSAL